MTAIPSSAIRLSYLWPCNAAMAAFTLSQTHGIKISALVLKLRWQEECENCIALRELGERPEKGFRQDKKVKLAERLVA
jgi:hypothetical protein